MLTSILSFSTQNNIVMTQREEHQQFNYLSPGAYDQAEATMLADPDEDTCPCGGSGWISSSRDVRYQCPAHPGRPHPDELAMDAYYEEKARRRREEEGHGA